MSKVVRIGEFARKQAAATAPRLVAARPALTPREIAHRFAMLAYLRKAR